MMMYCLNTQVSQLKLPSDHNCGSESSSATGDIPLLGASSNPSGHKQKGQHIRGLFCTKGKIFSSHKEQVLLFASTAKRLFKEKGGKGATEARKVRID